ncbi:MAG: stage 0 sporulation family protein [Fusobacteria bacterium]|nr:stage 0 sporulation family protein [Fusobacteriota bacterium]
MKYKVIGVIFEITKKRYFFENKDNIDYKKGDMVIVDTARGMELGKVYAETREYEEEVLVLPLKAVIRKATTDDIERYNVLKNEAKNAFIICREKITLHNLPMKLIKSEYTFDKTKLIFYFTAEGRIDFRALVKDLAAIFKLRIELRQIGVRDEARIVGEVGVCGKELCCRLFINKFDSIAIKMARDQGLVINPSKISGICGRLLCCIKYENEQYEEELKSYPAIGQNVTTKLGNGRVTSLNPLNGYLYVDIVGKGINKIDLKDVEFDINEANLLKEKPVDSEDEHKDLVEDYQAAEKI